MKSTKEPKFMISRPLIEPAVAILQKYFIFDRIFYLLDYDLNMDLLYNELQVLCRDEYEPNYRFIFAQYDTEYYVTQHLPGLTLINLQKILESLGISNYFCLILSHQDIQSMCSLVKQDVSPPSEDCSIATITNHLHSLVHPGVENVDLEINAAAISKKYISLNGAGRFHRRVLVSILQDKNLLEYGMVSYHGSTQYANK